jgi:histidine ammonia-lyase
MKKFVVNNQWISLQELEEIIGEQFEVELGEAAIEKIQLCRDYLDTKMAGHDALIYGINTGFGSLCNTGIESDQLGELQRNLVLSHACGMGEEVPHELVKRMLLLKVLGLCKGHSGVQVATVQRLLYFYNNNILPVVYAQGSLGASGDLAPLAHLCLPLIGEGEVVYKGEKLHARDLLASHGLEPISLQSKEGLALLNGTQFMSAYATYAVHSANMLWNNWNSTAALSLEAYDGRIDPFMENVNAIRNQKGQMETARIFRELLQGSERITRIKEHVQDPYSFRCIPQVHGASKDTIDYTSEIIEREINAVTDNPTIFPEEDLIVSAGNFHGQPLAIAMDVLAIAMAEMGSISERRVYKLISGTRGLPSFLVANSGLNSGFMIPQYTCASIVSQNKQLCTPASVDTIDSSNGQEDHVSMGANAATKLYRVIDNCWSILGIELMNAAQAYDFHPERKTSAPLLQLIENFRKVVPFVKNDTYLHPLMQASRQFVKTQDSNNGKY